MVCGGLACPKRARKTCPCFQRFLNFNMRFNRRSHNFKANSESMHKFHPRPHLAHSIIMLSKCRFLVKGLEISNQEL